MTAICCMAVAVAASAIDFNPEELYLRGHSAMVGSQSLGVGGFPLHVKYARIPLASGAIGPDISVGGLYHMPIRERWYLEPNVEVYYNHLKTTYSIKTELSRSRHNRGHARYYRHACAYIFRLEPYMARPPIVQGVRLPAVRLPFLHPLQLRRPTKIFQGTTARPLYGDYGTDLDVRAGLGYMWGHYYVGASFSYGIVRLTKSDFE